MLIPSTLRNGTIADHCGFMFMENHTAFEKLRFKNVSVNIKTPKTGVFKILRFQEYFWDAKCGQ